MDFALMKIVRVFPLRMVDAYSAKKTSSLIKRSALALTPIVRKFKMQIASAARLGSTSMLPWMSASKLLQQIASGIGIRLASSVLKAILELHKAVNNLSLDAGFTAIKMGNAQGVKLDCNWFETLASTFTAMERLKSAHHASRAIFSTIKRFALIQTVKLMIAIFVRNARKGLL